MRSQRLNSIILVLISVGIIAGFLYYLYINADQYINLLHVSAGGLAMLLALSLVQPFLNSLISVYMSRSLGADISQSEGFFLTAASTLANQLPISGGIVTRGFYLKQKYDLSYAKYFSAMLALFFCSVAVYGILGLAILVYWVIFERISVSPILFIGFGGMAAGLLIFLFPFHAVRIPNALLKWVQQALDGWLLISKNPVLVVKLLILQTSSMLLMAARYWLAFHMVSQNVTISQVTLFAAASVLTQLVSFAPGGLGVREAIVGGIATALGFDTSVSLVAVGLDRLVSTIMVVVLGWISTVILGRKISEKPVKVNEQGA